MLGEKPLDTERCVTVAHHALCGRGVRAIARNRAAMSVKNSKSAPIIQVACMRGDLGFFFTI